jgi:hypothetical protein
MLIFFLFLFLFASLESMRTREISRINRDMDLRFAATHFLEPQSRKISASEGEGVISSDTNKAQSRLNIPGTCNI